MMITPEYNETISNDDFTLNGSDDCTAEQAYALNGIPNQKKSH